MSSVLDLLGFRKLSLIRQSEAAECGLACIAMVARYHGFDSDLNSLRRQFPVSLRGMDLDSISRVANDLNLGTRSVRCDLNELSNLRTPAVLHWDLNHFVVLKKANKQNAVIFDPSAGIKRIPLDTISQSFTGVAMEFTPTPEFRRKKDRNPAKFSDLVHFGTTTMKALFQAFLLSIVLQLFLIAGPYYTQLVIDEAILKSDLDLLIIVAIGFGAIKFFETLSNLIRDLVFQFVSSVLAYDMEANLFHHMIRLPLSYFNKRHVGDIQQRFLSLLPIRDFVSSGGIMAVIDGLFSITLGIVLFAYDAQLALIVFAFITVYTVLRFGTLWLSKRLSGAYLIADAEENSKFLETLRAIQVVKASAVENYRENLWRNLAAKTVNAQIKLGNLNISFAAISMFLLGISNVLVVYLAATASIGGAMTIGMITAFLAYKSQFEQRIMSLIEQWIAFSLLDVHLERISDIALAKRESNLAPTAVDEDLEGNIELQSVSFRYAPFDDPVLMGASLVVSKGSFVAIRAPSGQGKSTLLKIIAGLYSPTSGKLLFDGKPVEYWGLQQIRRQMGIILQDDKLLAGSIAENISLFDDRVDHERVREAARLACIADDIEAMPMGFRSLVGDMGTTLSGGQSQRIMLARALYKNPKILIMDEGTSHLDVETEAKINENIKHMEITRIVAAHRIETLKAADRRVKISGGRIYEDMSPLDQNALAQTKSPDAMAERSKETIRALKQQFDMSPGERTSGKFGISTLPKKTEF